MKKASYAITQWIGTPASIFVHTAFFVASFSLYFINVSLDKILLILTTVVSLEAIYMAIFIQMTINRHAEDLEEVTENIEEISKDVEEISEDVGEISEDVEEISKDVDVLQQSEKQDDIEEARTRVTLENIQSGLQKLLKDIETLKQETLKH
ncbi:MAG: hypothetical protein Q8Q39_04370 [bacterium]|nr:hypothetical protein [bacterium]